MLTAIAERSGKSAAREITASPCSNKQTCRAVGRVRDRQRKATASRANSARKSNVMVGHCAATQPQEFPLHALD
jgi:hypothetical protein